MCRKKTRENKVARDAIFVKGAREHNLKNIDVEIPRDKLVVITGLSGSGKSSLAFDTLYAEGQRRYVESLSAYARQFLGLMEKPDVEYIEGLSPAVSIEQRTSSRNPRSTVGTVTEIHDYLRLLFARIGTPHCPNCGKKITYQTKEQITDHIIDLPLDNEFSVLSPIVRGRKGEYKKLFENLLADGYTQARVDGKTRELSEEIELDKNQKHDVSVFVDTLDKNELDRHRLLESVEGALSLSGGLVEVYTGAAKGLLLNEQMACPDCGISVPELEPRMFSFNNPHGACSECHGLGSKMEIDPDLVIPDKEKSIEDGAIAAWGSALDSYYYYNMVVDVSDHYDFEINEPVKDMKKKHLDLVLYGTGGEKIRFTHEGQNSKWEHYSPYEGVIPNLMRRYKETDSERMREKIQLFMSESPCTSCNGNRLKPVSLAVTVGGKNIAQLSSMSIAEAFMFVSKLKLSQREQDIAHQILKEILNRLSFLVSVGLNYLTLDRIAGTLSGGEAQRIRLATQIGSQLVGVLYILDEPSIGLHQKDNDRLLETLKKLRDLGNTVLVVEHDEETIREADYVVDLGPGAGVHGGHVVFSGTPKQLLRSKNSLTGAYLSGKKSISIPEKRRRGNGCFIRIQGASCHNLKNIDVSIPLGMFVCVTGVSGSGKSTLINETLSRILMREVYKSRAKPGDYKNVEGLEHVDKVAVINQSPIGRTPRSNPATYTGVFTPIRELYAQLPESKARGYKPGRFSFNVKGGRCEKCGGAGINVVEMHFLPDIHVTCDQCKGKRYNPETLEIRFKGKNISDVLEMTVEEALIFFKNIPPLHHRLRLLSDVGLGYIKIGQPATTLSGGEAQRIKIVNELAKKSTTNTVYLLDEPTTGLHFDDVSKLLEVLNRLVSAGNTVIVIEHNLDVIKSADYIIDLGPDGGDYGGEVIAAGAPEDVARNPKSYTGQYLKPILHPPKEDEDDW